MPSFQSVEDGILGYSCRSADLNDIGIVHLKRCQYLKAIKSFASALSLLNTVISSPHIDGPAARNGRCDQEYHHDHGNVIVHADSSSPDQCPPNDQSEDDANSRATHFTEGNAGSTKPFHDDDSESILILGSDELASHRTQLYKKPIHIPASLLVSTPTYEMIVEMSASIMFNSALSHHLAATSGQVEDAVKTMDQAVKLYELTHALQLQEGVELSIEHTMATICNLGHIHQLRGDSDKATKCFQHLFAIIVYLQSQDNLDNGLYQRDGSPGNSEEDTVRNLLNTDVFIHSVSFLVPRDSASAAAA